MVKLIKEGVYYNEGRITKASQSHTTLDKKAMAERNTISYGILGSHNEGSRLDLALRCDIVLAHPDCYVDIIRAAEASKLVDFPVPCICYDGKGEIPEFGESAARRYGGIYLPEGLYSPGEYLRTSVAVTNDLVLSSVPVTVGSLGAMAIRADAGAMFRVLFSDLFYMERPEIVAVNLRGKLRRGVGPLDVALSILRASEANGGFMKGRILEFFGAGMFRLPQDMRNAIDAYFTDMGCLATVWETDSRTQDYLRGMGREDGYLHFTPKQPAYYDAAFLVDLADIEPMASIGGSVFSIRELLDEPEEVLGNAEQNARRAGLPCEFRSLIKGRDIPVAGVLLEEQGSYEVVSRAAELLHGKKHVPCKAVAISESARRALERCGYLEMFLPSDLPDEGLIVGDGPLRMDAASAVVSAVKGKVTSALGIEYPPNRTRKYRHTFKIPGRKIPDFVGEAKRNKLDWGDFSPAPVYGPMPNAMLLKIVPAGEGGDFSEASDIIRQYGLPIHTPCGKLAVYKDLPVYDDDFRAALDLRFRGTLAVLSKDYNKNWVTSCVEWGIIPFTSVKAEQLESGYLYMRGMRTALERANPIEAQFLGEDKKFTLEYPALLSDIARAWLVLGGRVRSRGDGR